MPIQPLETCLAFSCSSILCPLVLCQATLCNEKICLNLFFFYFHVRQFLAWTLGPSITIRHFLRPHW